MTMLEKANAAAMAEVRQQLGLKSIPGDVGGGWAGRGDPGSLDFALIVRALLAAIREPDEVVRRGLASVDLYRADGDYMSKSHLEDPLPEEGLDEQRAVWQAGIDAILSEKPED